MYVHHILACSVEIYSATSIHYNVRQLKANKLHHVQAGIVKCLKFQTTRSCPLEVYEFLRK